MRHCEPTSLFELFDAYVEKNRILVRQIVSKIQCYDINAFFDSSSTEAGLEKYVDMVTVKERNIYYSDAPEVCDICKRPLNDKAFMIDGQIKGHGAWANMCADCFCTYGVKIGWGYGQLYKRDMRGWLLVGGLAGPH